MTKCYDNDGCKHLLDPEQVRPPFDVRTTEKYICELANCPLDIYKQARLDGMNEVVKIVKDHIQDYEDEYDNTGIYMVGDKVFKAIESAMEVDNGQTEAE